MSKLWEKSDQTGRSEASKKSEAFTVGNDYLLDQELVPYDIRGSIAHARALQRMGVLSEEEYNKLASGLDEILQEWKRGEFEIRIKDEDMHTAIELALVDRLGSLGKKIHTARSRNDQVLTAVRLYEKEKLTEIKTLLKETADAFLNFADLHKDIPMPGYTHTRKAMLSSVALWAGGYAELFLIQLEASCGIQSMIDRSPLGTAAGFGTSFPIDRETEAEELGFETPIVCSTTAQLSRGWIELQFTEYLCGITAILNRFASDLIQFSSEASPFFDLHEDVCTGSSIMPQKKNPDVAELLRAGHSVLLGEASKLRSLTINLGSGYHRDLQLTKEPLINSIQKTKELLAAAQLLIEHTEPVEDLLIEACSDEIFMAEAAYELVREKKIPFREAYQQVKAEGELSKIDVKEVMKTYTHIGSPGNAGIEYLRSKLNAFQN